MKPTFCTPFSYTHRKGQEERVRNSRAQSRLLLFPHAISATQHLLSYTSTEQPVSGHSVYAALQGTDCDTALSNDLGLPHCLLSPYVVTDTNPKFYALKRFPSLSLPSIYRYRPQNHLEFCLPPSSMASVAQTPQEFVSTDTTACAS